MLLAQAPFRWVLSSVCWGIGVLGFIVGRPSLVAAPRGAERLDALVDSTNYSQAHWGALVVDVGSGEILYSRNTNQLFCPASVTKLFSVAAAWDGLGPEHRFKTSVYRRGSVDTNGVLAGDLILLASGDLSMGGRTDEHGGIAFTSSDHTYAEGGSETELTPQDPLSGLNDLARQIVRSGIRRVTGDALIDDRLFEPVASSGSGPASVSPILINDNVIDVTISPSTAGSLAQVKVRPECEAFRIDARVMTVATNGEPHTDIKAAGPGNLVIRGHISAGHAPVHHVVEVPDPAGFARALLIRALVNAGVSMEASALGDNLVSALPAVGSYTNSSSATNLAAVAVLQSPPFREHAKLILKVSHNLHASALRMLLAVKNGHRTLAEGLKLERDFLARAGVDVDTISFGGGAGGTRADWVTPRAVIQLLRYLRGRPDFDAFANALPVMGIDGTLAKTVGTDSSARGRIRAKTGTFYTEDVLNSRHILISKALAGYASTSHGRTLAFALFVNNVSMAKPEETKDHGRFLGKLCEVIVEEW